MTRNKEKLDFVKDLKTITVNYTFTQMDHQKPKHGGTN